MQTPSGTPVPSWVVGDITVHRIDETPLPPATGPWLLPDATPRVVAGQDWLRPHFAGDDGTLHIDSHSFAFTVDGLRVLVDTGIGNGKERANPAWHDLRTDFPERLTAAGFPPDSVDLCVVTRNTTSADADHDRHAYTGRRPASGSPRPPRRAYLTAQRPKGEMSGAAYATWRRAAPRRMFRDSVILRSRAEPVLLDLQIDVTETRGPGEEIADVTPGSTAWSPRPPATPPGMSRNVSNLTWRRVLGSRNARWSPR
ncbi:hypothetical protein GCM10023238_35960 [Streptomyces heliomycini]